MCKTYYLIFLHCLYKYTNFYVCIYVYIYEYIYLFVVKNIRSIYMRRSLHSNWKHSYKYLKTDADSTNTRAWVQGTLQSVNGKICHPGDIF